MKVIEESEKKLAENSTFRKLRSWHLFPSFHGRDGETMETVTDLFWGAPKSLQMVTTAMKLKDAYSLEGKL